MNSVMPYLPRAAVPAAAASGADGSWLSIPTHWPVQGDLISWCHDMGPGQACLLVIGGIIYLLFGFYIFKGLVTLNAALLGGYVGAVVGDKANAPLPGAIVGGLLAAAVTWPLMKYAVAIMGGVFGALVGMSLWRLVDLDPRFAWAGGGMGFILLGLLSFLIFRTCIMAFTSLQGSVMLIFGVLSLLDKYPSAASTIDGKLSVTPFILPICIFVPTLAGVIYQQAMFAHDAAMGPAPKKG